LIEGNKRFYFSHWGFSIVRVVPERNNRRNR
jgi:hypothetical protein